MTVHRRVSSPHNHFFSGLYFYIKYSSVVSVSLDLAYVFHLVYYISMDIKIQSLMQLRQSAC